MRVVCVVWWCVVCACVCRGDQQTDLLPRNPAHDCELYRMQVSDNPPIKHFHRQVSMGILPKDSASSVYLQSVTSDITCQLFFTNTVVLLSCPGNSQQFQWPQEMLSNDDTTEVWVEVDEGGANFPPVWDLRVVGRRGRHRGHALFPNTSLQPPLNIWGNTSLQLQYYYNCTTGCLYEKFVSTASGDHTIYLRHDEGFTYLTLDPGPNFHNSSISLSVNVTESDLGPPGGVKNITVVWNEQRGETGVLVDGVPIDNLEQYQSLSQERQLKVTVGEDSNGLVASCDPRYKEVGNRKTAQVKTTTTTTTTTATKEPPISSPPPQDSPVPQPSHQSSCGLFQAVLTLVILIFLFLLGLIVYLCWYFLFKGKSFATSDNETCSPVIFSRQTSKKSSTRSVHRDSKRRNKSQTDGDEEVVTEAPIEDTYATSDTVTTRLTSLDSPDGKSQAHKHISTNEFVDLTLM